MKQEAIHMAMEEAMKKGLLADTLSRCETEVTTMLLAELASLIRYCCHRRDMMIWKMHRMIQRI